MNNINYPVVAVIILLAVVLVIYLVKRDRKDEKEFMDELNGTDDNPDDDKPINTNG